MFFDYNWFAVILLSLLPLSIIGMAAVLIRDRIKARKRNDRCHREISDWRDYGKEIKK